MALGQKSISQFFRQSALITGAGWRAFFAPFNVAASRSSFEQNVGPKILDLMKDGPITDSALPTGFFDLGWIKDVAPTPQTKIGMVRSGIHGVVRAQFKGEIGETLEFKMREITRIAMKIATASDVFNLLDNPTASTDGPLSGGGAPAAAMATYDPEAVDGPTLTLSVAASAALFPVGSYITVERDYDPNTMYGLVGDNASVAFQGSVSDVDYLRKTSDYVARVIDVQSADLILDQKFAGGGSGIPTGSVVPQAGSKVQKIKGFASREGGSYIMEWTGLFLLDTVDGAQFAFYYPHLNTVQFRGFPTWAIENIGNTDFTGYEMDCVMNALAFDDPLDGQPVTSYRAFYPRGRGQQIGY